VLQTDGGLTDNLAGDRHAQFPDLPLALVAFEAEGGDVDSVDVIP